VEQIHQTLDRVHDAFDSIWMDDHFVPWASWQSPSTPYLECATTMAYFAAAFPTLDIGASVFCQSYRNPALLAKMAANLQLLTRGRFVFGIGAGWAEGEYRAYNYDFPRAGVRLDQLKDTLEIVRRMWTESPASYQGKYYQITEAYCEPRPDPVPPIMIGGGGEKRTLRLVAQYADWWNINDGRPSVYEHKLSVLRNHCDAVGRDETTILKTWSGEAIALAPTEAEAQRIAAASPYNTPGSNAIIGAPAQVAEQIQAFLDLGVGYVIVRLLDFPRTDGIELFAREVMPMLRK
jgi:alkanesulfonate monooxygenase SsuD/methylene tetrahydromethanopterin reductase-like flavin-dependent oxidoreductase (luciferase family)